MRRIVPRRWKSKFALFIKSYGVESLAVELGVHSTAIYHWIRGSTSPRGETAIKIQELAKQRGVALSLDEIYWHSRAVRADNIRLGPGLPPRTRTVVAIRDSPLDEVRLVESFRDPARPPQSDSRD
jgi:hypothetical protein